MLTRPALPLSPRRLALLVGPIALGLLSGPCVWHVLQVLDRGMARAEAQHPSRVVVCTALATAALVALCVRAREPLQAAVGTIVGGALFGSINTALCFAAVHAEEWLPGFPGSLLSDVSGLGQWPDLLGRILCGLLFLGVWFLLIGGPVGVAFGAALAPLVSLLVSADEVGSREASERALAVAGAWCFALAALGHYAASGTPHASPAYLLLPASVALLGLGLGGLRRRRAFLGRVSAGLEPGWALVAADAAKGLPPYFHHHANERVTALLVRTMPAEGPSPYRSARATEAVAYVGAALPPPAG
ncbi:MAG TPA: hypothetical protein VFS43_36570 [Polyangiaceae bacterium]|nr:hypothetical protein [Polyangiaceae bacterium]